MNKLIAALIAAAFSFGAFAQTTAPAATSDKPAASASAPAAKEAKKTAKHKRLKKAS